MIDLGRPLIRQPMQTPMACIACHVAFVAHTDVAKEPRPAEPGDYAVCEACGHLQVYEAGGFREPTDDELVAVAGDGDLLLAVAIAGESRKQREQASLRLSDQGVQPNGVWYGNIVFRCCWAHPFWSDYALTAYDLDKPLPGGQPAFKRNPTATHEFMLWALQPERIGASVSSIDFAKPLSEQKAAMGRVLTPANFGYQLRAASDAAAWDRVNGLVDLCMARKLSPDTDARRAWDLLLADGWTLHASAILGKPVPPPGTRFKPRGFAR